MSFVFTEGAYTHVAGLFRSITYGAGLWVLVGDSGQIYTTPDLSTFTAQTSPNTTNDNWKSVAWNGSLFVAVGASSAGKPRSMSSSDGVTWTGHATSDDTANWQSVCWADTLSLWVAVASSGANRVMTSSDGSAWTGHAAATAESWQAVVWDHTLGILAAQATFASTTSIMTSTNGTAWTSRTTSANWSAQGITWRPSLAAKNGTFCSVVKNTSNNHFVSITSTNGTSWSENASAIPTNTAQVDGIVAAPTTAGLFLVPRINGGNAELLTSADGITFTATTAFSTNVLEYFAMGWSDSLLKFFAVDNSNRWKSMIAAYATVTSLSPSVGTYLGGTVVTITGIGFTGFASTITFGGTAAVSVNVVSDTTITCVTAAHAVGLVDVVVTGIGTLTAAYSYIGVTRVIPSKGPFIGGNTVTIRGFGFNAATGVVIDPDDTADAATHMVIVSNTTITCTMPSHARGLVDVAVTGVETGTELYTYTYLTSLPTDSAFTLPPIPYLAAPAPGEGGSPTEQFALMVKPWLTWLRTVKLTIEGLPTVSTPADQVIGLLSVDSIPTLPWTKVSKAGSSLADLTTRSASDLDTGTLPDGRFPALTGDVTTVAGAVATTLATVNSSPGSFGGGALIPIVTVNGKGLTTAVLETPVVLVGGGYTIGDLLYGASATTLARLADVATGSVLSSGGVATAPAWSTSPTISTKVTVGSALNLGTTSTDGVVVQNTTAATGGATVQLSPRLRFRGSAWNSSSALSETHDWYSEVLPITAAGSTNSVLRFSWSRNGSAATEFLRIHSQGSLESNLTIAGDAFWRLGNVDTGTGSFASIAVVNAVSNFDIYKLGSGFTSSGQYIQNSTLMEDNGAAGLALSATSGTITFWTANTLRGTFSAAGLLTLTTPLGVASGGTGTGTAFTAGSVVFAGASGVYTQDNANLFWDDTNNRLGIGTNSPSYKLDVQGSSGTIVIRSASNTSGDVLYYATGTVTGSINMFFSDTSATGDVSMKVRNTNTASASANAFTQHSVGGASAGDTYTEYTISGVQDWTLGIDNSDSDKFKIGPTGSIGSGDSSSIIGTTGGNYGIGLSPTARLHLAAGTATASTAPLKFTSGTLLTSAEAGAYEFLTDDFYLTITTGAARKGIVLNDGTNLTSGRVPFATTNGRLTDDSDMTFATDTLSITKVVMGAQLTLKGYTVATLPAGTVGQIVYASDLLAPTFLAAAVGGGAVKGPVFYDGTNWVAV